MPVYLGEPLKKDGSVVSYPKDRHVLLVGPSRSGKAVRVLVQNLMYERNRSMLVIDTKGELLAMTAQQRAKYGKIIVLNPFEVLGIPSMGYNPLLRLNPDDMEFPDDCTAMAEAVVKEEKEAKDPHWPESAQDLICALIMHECIEAKKAGRAPSLSNVRRLLCEPTITDDDGITGFGHTASVMASSSYEPLAAKGGRFCNSNDEINSIVSNAITQTRFLDSIPIARDLSAGDFDFGSMKLEVVTVYLILPANRLRTHGNWLRLIIDSALQSLYREPNTERERSLFILDEFAQLGHLPVIEDAMGIAAGYHVQLMPILQDLNQLNAIYANRWQSFIANSGVFMAFPPRDYFTAKYLSDMAGTKTIWVSSVNEGTGESGFQPSTSEGITYAPQQAPRWRPEELMTLPDGVALLFSEVASDAHLIHCPAYWENEGLKKAVMPNPYYKG